MELIQEAVPTGFAYLAPWLVFAPLLGLLINLFSAVFVFRTIFMWMLQRNPNLQKLSI